MQVVLDPDTKVMIISGEREVDRPVDDQGDFVRVERKVGGFERRFKLPDAIDPDNITAKARRCSHKIMPVPQCAVDCI
jgi:HSP20 family molecular chaperone IbpA